MPERQQGAIRQAIAAGSEGIYFSNSLPDVPYGLGLYMDLKATLDPVSVNSPDYRGYVRRNGSLYRVDLTDPRLVSGGQRVQVAPAEPPDDTTVPDLATKTQRPVIDLGPKSGPRWELIREAINASGQVSSTAVTAGAFDGINTDRVVFEQNGRYYDISYFRPTEDGVEMEVRQVDNRDSFVALVIEAIETNGEAGGPGVDAAAPPFLSPGGIVEYNGSFYQVRWAHVDYGAATITVSGVS